MHHPLRNHHRGANWKIVAAKARWRNRRPRHDVRRRIHSQHFADHRIQIGQALEIGHAWSAFAKNASELFVQPRFGGGILAEQIPCPGKRQRRGLVAGKKQRHRLVAQLPGRHLRAVFVHRAHQHGKQIAVAMPVSLRFALLDDSINQRIEETEFLRGAPVFRRGPAGRYSKRRTRAAQRIAHQESHRAAHLLCLARKRGAEKRSHGGFERQLHHFFRHVARIAVAPVPRLHLRAIEHRGRVFVDSVAMKRGLRQPPLPPPEISFADQQALPQQALGGFFRQRALVKFALLEKQQLLDVIRMVQQNAALQDHRDADDVAILPRHPAHQFQRVLQQIERHTHQRQAFRPRRHAISVCAHAFEFLCLR